MSSYKLFGWGPRSGVTTTHRPQGLSPGPPSGNHQNSSHFKPVSKGPKAIEIDPNVTKQHQMTSREQKDTEQQVLGAWAKHPSSGSLSCGSLQAESLHARAADFGSRSPLVGLGGYSLGVWSLGVYMLERPILDLATHSLDWEPTVWEFTVRESRVGQPILDVVARLPVPKSNSRGLFSVSVGSGSSFLII